MAERVERIGHAREHAALHADFSRQLSPRGACYPLGIAMISAHQCRVCSSDCAARAKGAYVSLQRAAILLAMSKRWSELADLAEQYEAIVKREENANRPR